MVHAGVQLFFVVFSFGVVICSITSYCLSRKTGAEPAARGPAGCGDPWGGLSICLQKPFFLRV